MAVTFALCLIFFAAAHAQNENVNTVCRNVVNTLNCGRFPQKLICGNDGVQYNTECEFAKAHCKDAGLKVVTEGACPNGVTPKPSTAAPATQPTAAQTTVTNPPDTAAPTATTPPAVITNTTPAPIVVTSEPVTSEPVTSEPITSGPMITQAATTSDPYLSDACNIVVNTPCGEDVNPLCANDGKTYDNYCQFSKGRCYVPGLKIEYSGQCSTTDTFMPPTPYIRSTLPPSVFEIICRALEDVDCLDDGVPVCATDGNAYPTGCDFEKAKCKDESIKIKEC